MEFGGPGFDSQMNRLLGMRVALLSETFYLVLASVQGGWKCLNHGFTLLNEKIVWYLPKSLAHDSCLENGLLCA